jgi:hypothetical protein
MTCFGMDPALLPPGATFRALLGTANEVMENVGQARPFDLAIDSTPGLTDLEHRMGTSNFLGCYISYHRNPWVWDRQDFFVNLDTGASILITSHYVE